MGASYQPGCGECRQRSHWCLLHFDRVLLGGRLRRTRVRCRPDAGRIVERRRVVDSAESEQRLRVGTEWCDLPPGRIVCRCWLRDPRERRGADAGGDANGSGWSIVASPDVGTNGNFLDSVSCTALNSCMAVGQYATTGGFPELTLAERWNGTSWSVVDTKNRDMTESNSLDSVSCAGPQFCMAVGEYPNTHHSASTLQSCGTGPRGRSPRARTRRRATTSTAYRAGRHSSAWRSAEVPSPGVKHRP